MSREAWQRIKASKGFYVRTYRLMGVLLVMSVLMNLILCAAISYAYYTVSQRERDYYATNGEKHPEKLTAMDSPNRTSMPLLADDPEDDRVTEGLPP